MLHPPRRHDLTCLSLRKHKMKGFLICYMLNLATHKQHVVHFSQSEQIILELAQVQRLKQFSAQPQLVHARGRGIG